MNDPDPTARLLRETLTERAAALDAASPGLSPTVTSARRRSHHPLLAAAAAAVVAALAVTGVAAWRSNRPTPAAPAPVASIPADWKPVASLGVQIYVPPSTRVTGWVGGCEVRDPAAVVVSRPFGDMNFSGCGPNARQLGTVIQFRPGLDAGQVPGRSVLPDGRTMVVWSGPDEAGVVVGTTADPSLLQRIIGTARAVDVDALGCGSVPPRLTWDHPRSGMTSVRLGRVTTVVACLYAPVLGPPGHHLVASGRMDDNERTRFVREITRAPAGAAPDLPHNCNPKEPESAYTVLRVTTTAGVSILTMHSASCVNRYVASAEGQSALSARIWDAVTKSLRIAWGRFELPGDPP